MRHIRKLTAPATEPVTLAEARLWCRIDDDDTTQDAMLLIVIAAARERAEDITGRAFMRRTLELRLDEFPVGSEPIELPYPPLASVEYLTYATGDGDVALSGSPQGFEVDTGSEPGRVSPAAFGTWPVAQAQPGAIRIGYTAGYATITQVPKAIRLWMQARVSTWYEIREQLVLGNVQAVPRDYVDALLDLQRVWKSFA